MTEVSPLTQYESAKRMLHQAVRVDEVLRVKDMAEQMALYGKQARDRDLMADAMEIHERAKRRLGELIIRAKQAGQIIAHRPKTLVAPDKPSEQEGLFQPLVITLADAGIDHKLSMRAQEAARLDVATFEAGIGRAREKILSGGAAVVNPSKDVSTAAKKAARAEKEQRLGARQRALPEAKFGVILTDDEWEFETWSGDGMDRAAANHYPVSALDALKKRDVASLAGEDAALFMWVTVPHLAQGLELMAHRGFAYKSHCIWRKRYPGAAHGMGRWFRVDHELLLVGTRGNVPAPAPGTQWGSVIEAPVGEHSEKPAVFYELIEAYFPSLPRVELNARRARPGWVRWGYEAPEDLVPVAKAEDTAPIPAPPLPQASASPDGSATGQGTPALTAESATAAIAETLKTIEPRAAADAAIRAGYAFVPFDPLPIVAVVSTILGRIVTKDYVKKRAHQLGLGSRERQLAAARRPGSAHQVADA